MKRTEMVRQGAQQLVIAENAVELAICETASLVSLLGRMRMDSRLSAVVGQDVMTALTDSLALLSNARGAMVRAHGHLDGVKTQLGCGPMAAGTGDDKLGSVPQTGRLIHVVSENEAA